MVDDDLFISKTYNNWYFGGDNSGNIMNRNNILDLKEKISCDVGYYVDFLCTILIKYRPFS